MSWHRKVLRVDLSKGTITAEPLNMEWADQYLGQRGLATKYFVEEVDATVDPLSPDNKLIFATGPLTGTMASTGGRYSVITKGPLTGAIACSNSGGYIGAEIRFAGWDMIILEGRSPEPVYLHIQNDQVELLPAKDFIWGKTVWETEELIKKKHQDPQMRVCSVGRPAEQGALYAAIVNDMHRAAGRSGVGTVMASKNVKAIAVRGTKGVGNIAQPREFFKATAAGKKVLADNAVTGQGLPTYGTQVLMNIINELGASPTHNHKDTQFEGAHKISGEAMHEKREDGSANLVTNQACFGCTIACGRISKVDKDHFTVKTSPKYWGASGGLEYEAAWALGNANGVDDLDALTYVNFLCNEDGLDPISFGATIGAAMELYELGAITEKDVGFPLPWGDAQAMVKLAEMTCKGEGFGKDIGLGSKRLTEKYGHPDLSMSVKGQEFPAYDGRALQGMGLAYATSNRGACHLRGYMVSTEVLGIPFKTEPQETENKPEILKAFQDATAVVDSAGICVFTTFAWSLEDIQPQIQAACEGDWSMDKLNLMGERIWNMEREFNLRAGFTAKDDTLPKRLLTEGCNKGPQKGAVTRLDIMMPKYYEVRGWDQEGVPTPETKQRLGL